MRSKHCMTQRQQKQTTHTLHNSIRYIVITVERLLPLTYLILFICSSVFRTRFPRPALLFPLTSTIPWIRTLKSACAHSARIFVCFLAAHLRIIRALRSSFNFICWHHTRSHKHQQPIANVYIFSIRTVYILCLQHFLLRQTAS